MFRLGQIRFLAIFLSLVTVLSMAAVDTAEARRFGGGFGGFGNRGTRTYQTVPPTKTSPSVTAPVQKPIGNTATPAQTRSTGVNTGLFGGGLMRGLFLGGLFGLFLGTGFGGFGGVFSLLFQLLLVGGVLWLLFGRRRVVAAGGPSQGAPPLGGYGAPGRAKASPYSGAGRAASTPIEVSSSDLDTFEDRLKDVQDAYSRGDEARLARLTTPEVFRHLKGELQDLADRGLRNEVLDVRMLGGSVAEAWREGRREFATVAMRYESRDVMRERATGRIVSGSDAPTETTEVWTFMRETGAEWLLSAMQPA